MKKMRSSILVTIVALFFVVSCQKNPLTGRSQLALVPKADVENMAQQQYRQFLTQSRVVSPNASKDAEMIQRVGSRLSAAVGQLYSSVGAANEVPNYKWEFNLVDSKEVNAWCMPGGKVVFYTGILPVTQNEAAVAVVMGHEIMHALGDHGRERMSQSLVQQLGGIGLAVALSNKPAETQNIFMNAYGIGTTVGLMLPFSRRDELEADEYGLFLAAMAGYNPQEAVPFWKRMGSLSAAGQKPPEFLSTHPSDETRISKLEVLMPQALKYYKPIKNK
jgi:predicted Zn-dependent protease